MKNRYPWIRSAIFLTVILTVVAIFLMTLYRTSKPHLLLPQGDAKWFVTPANPSLDVRSAKPHFAAFRSTMQLASVPPAALARLHSLGQAELLINDQLTATARDGDSLLNATSADLAPYLKPGSNEIVVIVVSTNSPAAISFDWSEPGFLPVSDWQVSEDGGVNWSRARLANTRLERSPEVLSLSSTNGSLANIGILFLLALLGGTAALVINRLSLAAKTGDRNNGLRVWRWLLVASLALLYIWNFKRLPIMMGMDTVFHLEYVEFILTHGSLPFGDQGWQMFQPPLAYLFGAVVEPLWATYAPGLAPSEALRTLTILCSLGIAWVGCHICEISFKHTGTAAAVMVVTTFLPVNLYMGQGFGNEPFAAFFGSLLIFETVRLIKGTELSPAILLRVGLWFGLGLLSKPTVLLLFPGVLLVVIQQKRINSTNIASLGSAGLILLVSAGISGWWYARNMFHFGRPFVGGWELGRGLDWWQYPGFRVPEHWLRFGESLINPFYSGLDSFWDGVYSTIWLDGGLSGQTALEYAPPWNLYSMAGLALFSLPFLALMLWGASRASIQATDGSDRMLAMFASGNTIIFLMAMAIVFGQVPSYSAAKGSYLLSAMTCLPLLIGLGLHPMMKHILGRVAVSAFLACWTGLVVMAFAVN